MKLFYLTQTLPPSLTLSLFSVCVCLCVLRSSLWCQQIKDLYYTTLYGCNLLLIVKSYCVCHLQPLTATYSHLQPLPATYSHLQPLPATSSHFQPLPATYSHLQPLPATSSPLQPLTATYSHLQPSLIFASNVISLTSELSPDRATISGRVQLFLKRFDNSSPCPSS